MSIMNFIAKLQKSPESSRRRALLVSTSGITLLIAIVWIGLFYSSILAGNGSVSEAGTSTFETLKANMAAVKAAFNF